MAKRETLYYGWIIVLIIICSNMLIYGIRHSFAVFFSRIIEEFHWSRGDIAIMFSLNVFVYGLLAPFAGTLAEYWKPRVVMPLGIALLGLATAGCALANKLSHFYFLFGFLMSLGSALSGWPILAPALMNWFVKRRGLVLGIGQMGGGLSFVYSMFVEFTISNVGWRNTFFILAVILVIFLLPLYFLFFHYRPEDKGLQPYGEEDISTPALAQAGSRKPILWEWTLREVIKDPRLWLLVTSYALYWGIGAYMVMAHQVKFTEDAGYSSLFSASIFALSGVTLILGQLSAFLSDWMGREKTVTLATSLAVVALLALLSVKDTSRPWLLFVYSFCFGYGSGLYSPSIFAATADIFHGPHFSAAAGLLLTGMGVGGAIGPWLGGFLYDLSGSYLSSFILCMVSMALACVCLWLAAPRRALKKEE